jgi:hypothetical protein
MVFAMKVKIHTKVLHGLVPSMEIQTLSGTVVPGDNNMYDMSEQWHCLKVKYTGRKLEILDLFINDQSVKHLLYTGYFQSKKSGKIYQPATAVWEEGHFVLWMHPNLGAWQKQMFEQIENGKFGKNLFNDYALTVDRPMTISDHYPDNVKGFFKHAVGPCWWQKDSIRFPYRQLDIDVTQDIRQAVARLEKTLTHKKTINGWIVYDTGTPTDDADPRPLSNLNNSVLEDLLTQSGYTQWLSVSVLTLNPGCFIEPHIDDHTECKNIQYVKGCQKFYMSLDNLDGVHFKLGSAGLLPLDKPLLLNTNQHTHSVVNQGATPRKVLLCYGVLGEKSQ